MLQTPKQNHKPNPAPKTSLSPFIKGQSNVLPPHTFIKMERSRKLDNDSRKQIIHELLLSVNSKGKPALGVMGEMSKKYKVSRKTISRSWRQIKQQQQYNAFPIDVNSKSIGKKSRNEIKFDDTKFKGLEKAKKTSQTEEVRAIGVSQSTVWR